jgi:hypothetical protein
MCRKAARQGQDPAAYVAEVVDRDLSGGEGEPKTLAQMFAGRIGRIHSGGTERLSEDCGERFTDYLEDKRREGRL